ncbi:putative Ig domain-containing protein, partial [Escherichia coli]|uniref:putative Ig domain-containing protein n=1 Tax=Escherichia coli TaxID=562 RepID=UPI0019546762
ATNKVLTPSGGLAPYTTTLQSGTLPNGVSWSSNNGTVTIAGTPSALGTSTMTYKVTDSRGRTNTATVSIAVTSVLAINGQPPNFGTVG